MRINCKSLLALIALLTLSFGPQATAQDAKRYLQQIEGDVYRFQNNFHFAMVVVTDDGIVVTDPINADAVAWLKDELSKRFAQPLTHMIFSHSHADHASGGQGWGDIEVIAHEEMRKHVKIGAVDTAMPTTTFSSVYSFDLGSKTFEPTYLANRPILAKGMATI